MRKREPTTGEHSAAKCVYFQLHESACFKFLVHVCRLLHFITYSAMSVESVESLLFKLNYHRMEGSK